MMKKIQDGLKYDTETATLVAEDCNGYDRSNYNYWTEQLYRTQNGRWFVYKAGGANTQYMVKLCDGRGFGESIEILDEEAVKEWLEEHNKGEAYEKYFGNEIENA